MRRRALVRLLLVAGTVLGVLAILSIWVGRQALETDQWTDTSSKVLEDPAVQTVVAGYLVDQLYANTDVTGQIRAALPPRAQPLAGTAAAALRNGAEEVAQRALDRPRVQQAWEAANRQAHEQLVDIVEGGTDNVSTEHGVVTLNLKGLLDQVAQRAGVGARAVQKIPADAATVEILRSDQLDAIQTIGRLLKPLAAVLVVLMLACFGGAIALASGRRRQTLRASGIALVLAGIATLAVRSVAGGAVVDGLATTESVRPAIQAVWDIGTSLLVGVAVATIAYGILVIIAAWLAGPTRAAVSLRELAAPYLRDPLVTYGAVAAIVLLVLLWGPTEGTRRVLPALVLFGLLVVGVEVLRRQTAREFPDAQRGAGRAALKRARATVGRRGRPAQAADQPEQLNETALAQLERLSELHRSGGLDDDEFTTAKHKILSNA